MEKCIRLSITLSLIFIIISMYAYFRHAFLHRSVARTRLFVRPQWGLGNRLRTMSGAFAAARQLDVDCIIVWQTDTHFPQVLSELYSNIPMTTIVPTSMRKVVINDKCEYIASLQQLEQELPCLIEACAFTISETDVNRDGFYSWAKLVRSIKIEIEKYSEKFVTPRLKGIHLRQGDIADARDGNFFGAWNIKQIRINSADDLSCCTDDTTEVELCPSNVDTIDHRLRQIGSTDVNDSFWVATDRIRCIHEFQRRLAPATVRFIGYFTSHPNLTERDMRLAIIDMYMLSKCAILYTSQISSFSAEIAVIRKGLGMHSS